MNWVLRPKDSAKLSDLAPSDNANQAHNYIESLIWGVENSKVKNIALTGTYGSGKSSVLETFRIRNPQYHFLNISLANFRELETVKERQTKENIYGDDSLEHYSSQEQRLIETSILQQIFYSVKGSDIPDSRFNRIKRLSGPVLFLRMVMLILTSLALIFLIKPTLITELPWFSNNLNKTDANTFNKAPIVFGSLIIIIVAIAMLAGYLFRNLNQLRFNKLNLVQGELEIERQSEVSILNNYLEELIYFFEATNFNVVILEDLDRFRSPEIFTKLRELNLLLNNAQQIGRRIVFIYAIKDDMFQDKTRTKFFDLIVPIIPIINSTNSLGVLQKIINDSGLSGQIDENLLSDITLYIDDMRVLKNIINEYSIYKKSLLDSQVNLNQLFSIIVYKNVNPKDFARLERRKGILFDVFDKVDQLHNKLTFQNSKRIDEIEEEIESASKVHLKSLGELRAIYSLALMNSMPEFSAIEVNGERVTPGRFSEENIFSKLIASNTIRYFFKNSNSYNEQASNFSFSFLEIEKKVDPQKKYIERKEELSMIVNNQIDILKNEVADLKKQNSEIRGMRLQDIMTIDIDILDTYGEWIKDQDLLKYFLRHGCIDEMYPLLISYFYEGDITMTDLQYIRKVKDGGIIAPDYQLYKLQGVITKLKPIDLQSTRALNISLLDYLLAGNSNNTNYLNSIIKIFLSPNEVALKFIPLYFENGVQVQEFVNKILYVWDDLFRIFIANPSLTVDKRNEYISIIIQNLPNERLIEMNVLDSLKSEISKDFNILKLIEKGNIPNAFRLLVDLKVSFTKITSNVNEEILNLISKHQLYDFNVENLSVIVKAELGDDFEDNLFANSNYSYLRSNCTDAVTNRIDQDHNTYLTGVLLNLAPQTEEKESYILELLAGEETDKDLRVKLVEKVATVLNNVTSLTEDTILNALVQAKLVEMNYSNLMHCYSHFGLNESLVGFIDGFFGGLPDHISNTFWENNDDFLEQFAIDLLSSVDVSIHSYKSFANHITDYHDDAFESLPLDNLQEEKVAFLIDKELIELNPDNYIKLQNTKSPMHLWLVATYKEEFFSNFQEYTLFGTDIIYLLKMVDFTASEKVKIVTLFIDAGNSFNSQDTNVTFELLANLPILIEVELLEKLDKDPFTIKQGRLQIIDSQLDYHSTDKILPFILKDSDFNPLGATTKKKATLPGYEPFLSICNKLRRAGFLTNVYSEGDVIEVWKGKTR